MTNPELDKYKVDHLFLLIGENPLPNYVAAKTLLKSGGKPYLVYTEHTEGAANKLQEILGTTENERVPLERNESNGFKIQELIKQKVREIQKQQPSQSFGLNYTGGTKAMAVHAYQAFLNLGLEPKPKFSYLDPRSLKMLIDQKAKPCPIDIMDNDIRSLLDISFERLFDLHDLHWKEDKPPISSPCMINAAKELLELYLQRRDEIAESYLKWSLDKDGLGKAKNGKFWRNENHLENVEIDLSKLPERVIIVLKKHLNLTSNKFPLRIAKNYGFKLISHFCDWLNYGWVEHYVLSQVQQIRNLKIDETAMSFHIEDSDNPDADWDKFEFDVAFRRGHQLFALSCTTSIHDDTCKEKLFEAYVRARQLGGAEARVAVICPHYDPNRLEKQMKVLTQDRKIAVFGKKHLRKLSQSISNWIQDEPY
ncbi:DUF1887 domain-containing protein [Pseudanabaena sp. FACHB-1277]|uniref:DUF1887 domain-containing protein n=1 Tax=Pseudanabaena cinerea FACHB-1277 TaxID=2949581 RepID=A0A926UT84_9CYAN|nr:DUF1887 domain-containing protein [Pseudanabaena cinerea]MBD2150644.1 DUF1887 domain-containing protein [Pseudanabaena cinerea FACHB-1277]